MGIDKNTQPFKPHLADKILQFLKIFIRLARVTNQHGCPKVNTRHLFPNPIKELNSTFLRDITAHQAKDVIAAMLKCDIKVFGNIWLFTHHREDFKREIGRIGIMKLNPFYPFDLG